MGLLHGLGKAPLLWQQLHQVPQQQLPCRQKLQPSVQEML